MAEEDIIDPRSWIDIYYNKNYIREAFYQIQLYNSKAEINRNSAKTKSVNFDIEINDFFIIFKEVYESFITELKLSKLSDLEKIQNLFGYSERLINMYKSPAFQYNFKKPFTLIYKNNYLIPETQWDNVSKFYLTSNKPESVSVDSIIKKDTEFKIEVDPKKYLKSNPILTISDFVLSESNKSFFKQKLELFDLFKFECNGQTNCYVKALFLKCLKATKDKDCFFDSLPKLTYFDIYVVESQIKNYFSIIDDQYFDNKKQLIENQKFNLSNKITKILNTPKSTQNKIKDCIDELKEELPNNYLNKALAKDHINYIVNFQKNRIAEDFDYFNSNKKHIKMKIRSFYNALEFESLSVFNIIKNRLSQKSKQKIEVEYKFKYCLISSSFVLTKLADFIKITILLQNKKTDKVELYSDNSIILVNLHQYDIYIMTNKIETNFKLGIIYLSNTELNEIKLSEALELYQEKDLNNIGNRFAFNFIFTKNISINNKYLEILDPTPTTTDSVIRVFLNPNKNKIFFLRNDTVLDIELDRILDYTRQIKLYYLTLISSFKQLNLKQTFSSTGKYNQLDYMIANPIEFTFKQFHLFGTITRFNSVYLNTKLLDISNHIGTEIDFLFSTGIKDHIFFAFQDFFKKIDFWEMMINIEFLHNNSKSDIFETFIKVPSEKNYYERYF